MDSEAIVIALTTKTAPIELAVAQSVESAKWLNEFGATQFYFKYCSTFDFTEEGNIGTVCEALLDYVEGTFTIICPNQSFQLLNPCEG